MANTLSVQATCQNPTALNQYSMPTASCGAPATVHRSDRMFVRYFCANCAGTTEMERP